MRPCAASCSLRACDSTSPPVSEEQTPIRRLTAILAVIFLPNLRFIMGDMLDLPFDGRSDMVSSNTGLHWVSDHGRAFSGIARALGPGKGPPSDGRKRERRADPRARGWDAG